MATERTRRRAIQHVGKINPKKLKETRTSSGSTTGIIETYFITSTCTSFEDCSTPILPDVPPPIILDGSSWSYPGNMSFTTSNIPSSRNVLDLILTVNNDIVNNDMTIVFAGNTVLTATVGAIELIVNDGIISVPSGTFGLTDNSLNIIFENVINAGSNLDMTINPVFQELYLDTRDLVFADYNIFYPTSLPKATKFIKLTLNINNIMNILTFVSLEIDPNRSDNSIYARTSSGGILWFVYQAGFYELRCPPGTFVEGNNDLFIKSSEMINNIGIFIIFPDV